MNSGLSQSLECALKISFEMSRNAQANFAIALNKLLLILPFLVQKRLALPLFLMLPYQPGIVISAY